MIRLFIVDDEMMIRQGIRYAINWEQNDVMVCGEAANGLSALRSLAACAPDVVIADIQMPQMDGFSFIAKARELLPRIKVIVLTGYGSRDYMAQAIRSGATDYLEKPANGEDILASVLKVKRQIESEREDSQRSEDARQLLSATGNLSRAWLIQNLFSSGFMDEFSRRVGDLLGIQLDEKTTYHVLLTRPAEQEIWPLLTALSAVFQTNMVRHLISLGLIGGLLDARLSREEIRSRLEGVGSLRDMCHGQIVIYENVNPLLHGQQAFEAANRNIRCFYLYEPGSVVFMDSATEAEAARPPEYASVLRKLDQAALAAENGHYGDARDICGETLDLLAGFRLDSEQFYGFVQQMLMRVAHAMRRDDQLAEIPAFLSGLPSLSVIRARVAAIAQGRDDEATSDSVIIERAIAYMKDRLAEPLSVVEAAANCYLSPAYFGRLFKKETNMSFNSYLTGLRAQEAKRLLRETDMKNYEIAMKVGFSSYKLFALSFQKQVGLSASEYRARYRRLSE